MVLNIEVKGLSDVRKFINSKNKRATMLVKRGLSRGAIVVQGEVKDSIAGNRAETKSVDTGRFLNSVEINVKLSALSARIFSGLPYVNFLEYGTSSFVGRKHFSNSANRTKQKVALVIQNELNKI